MLTAQEVVSVEGDLAKLRRLRKCCGLGVAQGAYLVGMKGDGFFFTDVLCHHFRKWSAQAALVGDIPPRG